MRCGTGGSDEVPLTVVGQHKMALHDDVCVVQWCDDVRIHVQD